MAGLVAMARRVAVCLRGTAELLGCWTGSGAPCPWGAEPRAEGAAGRSCRDMAEGMIGSRSASAASAERLSRLVVCVVSCCLWLSICWRSCEGHLNFPHGINKVFIYLSIYLCPFDFLQGESLLPITC